MPGSRCQLCLPRCSALPDRAALHCPFSRSLSYSSLRFLPATPHIKISRTGRSLSSPHPFFPTTISSRHSYLASRTRVSHFPPPCHASVRNFTTGSRLSRPHPWIETLPAALDRYRVSSLPLELKRSITGWGGYSEATMAPKQATLGYVKSGQTTLGLVITKKNAFW